MAQAIIVRRGGGSGKTSIVNATVTLGTSHAYTGSAQTQTITSVVLNGVTLTESEDFTVSGNTATNVGDYSLTLTGINNFEGTKTVLWEIEEPYIFGIERNVTLSSPAWTRTDGAENMSATASIGTQAGASDFDSVMPWSGIERETLSTNDVMVKIPKFWYQRNKDVNTEHIRIANRAVEGFTLHPAFNHAGVEKDFIYVGAYKTSSNNRSVPNAAPQGSQTRATMRTNARAKGNGTGSDWGLIDIAALSAIQMLILVEFANNNVQAVIGRGYCDANTALLDTGSCDSVPNLTGRPSGVDGKTDVVWRGIEGPWGNVWEWVDGLNWSGSSYYVCNDPAQYADDVSVNYAALSFTGDEVWSTSYIIESGIDTGSNGHIMLPSAAGGGSESTYYCDGCWATSGWMSAIHGGTYNTGSLAGLFTINLITASNATTPRAGSRLMYIPQ